MDDRTLFAWTPAMLLGGIGLLLVIVSYGAILASKKENRHISGVPVFGGVLIALGFLLSPCKWLAFLGLIDYGIWEIGWLCILRLLIEPLQNKRRKQQPPRPPKVGSRRQK